MMVVLAFYREPINHPNDSPAHTQVVSTVCFYAKDNVRACICITSLMTLTQNTHVKFNAKDFITNNFYFVISGKSVFTQKRLAFIKPQVIGLFSFLKTIN